MTVNRRRAPPHPLLLPGSQQRDPTPAFGKIATYSHRLPPLSARRRWSARKSSLRPQQQQQSPTASEQHSLTTTGTQSPRLTAPRTVPSPLTPAAQSAQLLRAIAVAEVGMRQPFRRAPRQREEATVRAVIVPPATDVTVDIQPATPRGDFPPTQEEEARPNHHQPATLHSILMLDDDDDDDDKEEEEDEGDEAVEIIRFEPQPAGESFHYLRPDLSGASGLSIHHFEAHGRSISSSSTETLVDFSKPVALDAVDARLPVLLPSSEVPQEPSLMMHNRSASAPTGPVQAPQHLAELFDPPPRAYLCPWELDAPPPAHHIEKHHHHRRRSDFENSTSREKPLPQPISAGSLKSIRCEGRWQRKHAVTAALVLLTVLILTDLVALNIRVWSLRDAYYDE